MTKTLRPARALRAALVPLIAALLAGAPALAEAGTFSTDYQGIDDAAQSVLMLYWEDADNIYTGSAFVAFQEDMLLTNYHVIKDARDEILAYGDNGEEYVVDKIYAGDADKDLALVGFAEPTGIAPLTLGDTRGLLRAEPVVAIGSPKGRKNTVSLGNVSGMFEEEGVRYVQFTAPISSGSSGGALFDNRGRVIGVTSAYYTDAQNINLAVDIAEAQDLYARMAFPQGVAFSEYWAWENAHGPSWGMATHGALEERNFRAAVAFFWVDRGKNINLVTTEKRALEAEGLADFAANFSRRDYYSSLIFSMDAAEEDARVAVELELVAPDGRAYSIAETMSFGADARDGAEISTNIGELLSRVRDAGVYTLTYKVEGAPIASGRFEIRGAPVADERDSTGPTAAPGIQSTAAPTTAEEYAQLAPGARGAEVQRMQRRLIELGYLAGAADGIYGKQTERAVRAFQQFHGLQGVTFGTADPDTLALLYSGEALPYADAEIALFLDRDANLDWYGSGKTSKISVVLVNTGHRKTVTGYTLHVRVLNALGEVEFEDAVEIAQRIAPGETQNSRRIPVRETGDSYEIEVGILSITYDDGTTVEIERPSFLSWWM